MLTESGVNLSVNYIKCYQGDCSFIDNLTCLETERPDNISGGELVVDRDGCFSTNHLRTTDSFQHYIMVGSVHSKLKNIHECTTDFLTTYSLEKEKTFL